MHAICLPRFSAILPRNPLPYESMPAEFLCNLPKKSDDASYAQALFSVSYTCPLTTFHFSFKECVRVNFLHTRIRSKQRPHAVHPFACGAFWFLLFYGNTAQRAPVAQSLCGIALRYSTGLMIFPMPSTSHSTTSPCFRYFGGTKPIPTPAGVPMEMIVPAGIFMAWDSSSMT